MTYPSLDQLAMKFGVSVGDEQLWLRALTHRSFAHENGPSVLNNERLEFLGDAIIELAVTEHIYDTFPKAPEGKMALMRTSVVRTESLAEAARRLSLGRFLRLGKGEIESGGRDRDSLLADAFEAMIGVIYIEHGWHRAKQAVSTVLGSELNDLQQTDVALDPKTELQQSIQARFKQTPTYKLVKRSGPDHDVRFTVEVHFRHRVLGVGRGSSIRSAEQRAAQQALNRINTLEDPS